MSTRALHINRPVSGASACPSAHVFAHVQCALRIFVGDIPEIRSCEPESSFGNKISGAGLHLDNICLPCILHVWPPFCGQHFVYIVYQYH